MDGHARGMTVPKITTKGSQHILRACLTSPAGSRPSRVWPCLDRGETGVARVRYPSAGRWHAPKKMGTPVGT